MVIALFSPERVHQHVGGGERSGNVLGQRVRHVAERFYVGGFAGQTLNVILVELRIILVEFVGRGGHRPVNHRKQIGKQSRSGVLQTGPRDGFRVFVHVPQQSVVEHIQKIDGRSFDAHVHVRNHSDRFALRFPDHVRHMV